MTTRDLLDHDSSGYAELFARIVEISKAWRSRQTMREQLTPLIEIWRELERDHDAAALPKSMAAHLLADLQTDPAKEYQWDLESLRALSPIWEQRADPRLFDAGCRCLPSIFLSLACAARKCGDPAGAREYLRRARLTLPILPDGRYASELASAIQALERVLTAGSKA